MGLAERPSLIAQKHGGALLSDGILGNPGHNQHTVRQRAQEVRGQLIGQLDGAAKDLAAILETARESDGCFCPLALRWVLRLVFPLFRWGVWSW